MDHWLQVYNSIILMEAILMSMVGLGMMFGKKMFHALNYTTSKSLELATLE